MVGPCDEAYFEAYGQLDIHALMLRDHQRVSCYLAAIRLNKAWAAAAAQPTASIQNRLVLDVGAGSGILAMLAAKHGGAKHVYAVEAVPSMASLARRLVQRNGLETQVTVLEGRIEDVELPSQMDVIISEWMGFYLVHESMLESVLHARDRWLKPQGLLLPSSARILAAPVEAEELRAELEGYGDLHGLDLSFVGEERLASQMSEPQVETVEPRRLLGEPVLAFDLGDLHKLPAGSTREFKAKLTFTTWRPGRAAGIAFWFDVGFSGEGSSVTLKTDPGSPSTHWQQTVVYLGVFAAVDAGDILEAEVTMRQSESNPRQYDISIETQ
ncbi:PRMT6 [Symbiodinium microadriaticum]|nr:PRMT6 [Symbiodinium microadriaticum]